jgi:hypothetical protein
MFFFFSFCLNLPYLHLVGWSKQNASNSNRDTSALSNNLTDFPEADLIFNFTNTTLEAIYAIIYQQSESLLLVHFISSNFNLFKPRTNKLGGSFLLSLLTQNSLFHYDYFDKIHPETCTFSLIIIIINA